MLVKELNCENCVFHGFFSLPCDTIQLNLEDPESLVQCRSADSQTSTYSASRWFPACGTAAVRHKHDANMMHTLTFTTNRSSTVQFVVKHLQFRVKNVILSICTPLCPNKTLNLCDVFVPAAQIQMKKDSLIFPVFFFCYFCSVYSVC